MILSLQRQQALDMLQFSRFDALKKKPKNNRLRMKLAQLALIPLLFLNSMPLFAETVLVDRAVAIVNNDVITQSQLDQLSDTVRYNAAENGQQLPSGKELNRQLMDRLIDESLQLQLAEKLGMRVGDSQLESAIENILKGEKKTREQLLEELRQTGSSYRQFREQVRNEILIGEIRRSQVQRRVSVTEQETETLIEKIQSQDQANLRYRIGHILIKLNESNNTNTDDSQALQQAQQLTLQLRKGADLHQLALKYSQGPKALEGGDWGFMGINEMPTLFADVVKDKHQGDVIGPFRSGSGLHLVQILDVEGEQKVETTEVNALHILVKPSIILSDKRAKELLEELRTNILSGKGSFEDYARQYSEDPGSAVKGGELGWADPNIYAPAFRDTALRLEKGQISEPFRSTFGWHIMKMVDKRTTDTTEQTNEKRARQIIYNRKFNDEAQSWLNELREDAYIEIIENLQS
jgi:peptidyl-prolyl cis-trans isomerase SurA